MIVHIEIDTDREDDIKNARRLAKYLMRLVPVDDDDTDIAVLPPPDSIPPESG